MSDQQFSSDDYVSIETFAKLSDFSVSTIHRRIKDGTLPVFQPAGPGTRLTIPVTLLSTLTAVRKPANVKTQPPAVETVTTLSSKKLPGRTPAWQQTQNTINPR